MKNYQEELARLQLEDRKKKEKEIKEYLEGWGGLLQEPGCWMWILILSVILGLFIGGLIKFK